MIELGTCVAVVLGPPIVEPVLEEGIELDVAVDDKEERLLAGFAGVLVAELDE